MIEAKKRYVAGKATVFLNAQGIDFVRLSHAGAGIDDRKALQH
jgi:hypothetical protein